MKRVLLLLLVSSFVYTLGFGQVFANFETNLNDYKDNAWGGTAFSGVTRVVDPTSKSAGVMQIALNLTKKTNGSLGLNNALSVPAGAQFVTYWVYLPAVVPDSLVIGIYAQDNKNWVWTESQIYAKDIPKQKWYPISNPIGARYIANSSFDIVAGKLLTGIQIANWDVNHADSIWSGNILVDNVSWEGVQPNVIANFETNLGDYKDNAWGGTAFAGVTRVTDPTGNGAGVMQIALNLTKKTNGSLGLTNAATVPAGTQFITYWVYLPAVVPDNLVIGVYAQDNKNWVWTESQTFAKDIPKQKWYPLSNPIGARYIANPNFDIVAGKLLTGIQIANFDVNTADSLWSGNILVNDVAFLSEQTGASWVLVDFESAAAGTNGFSIPGYGAAATAATREKPAANGYMKLAIDPTKGSPVGQWAVIKNDISILDTITKNQVGRDSLIDAVGIDILVPANYSASTVGIVFQPNDYGWPWLQTNIPVKDSAGCVAPGKWSTIKWKVSDWPRDTIVNAKVKGTFCVQSSAAGTTPYEIDFDNLTLYGIPQPSGQNLSPKLVVTTDTVKANGTNKVVNFVKFEWIDNTLGSEKYNIYMSKVGPINNLTSTDVVKIATDIGHGLQVYGYRPYSTNGDSVTLYFAITSVDNGNESALNSVSKAGPIRVKTTPTFKIQYVGNFASKFVLDGTDDEFVPYKSTQINPESSGGPNPWVKTKGSDTLDLNFHVTMIIDSKYLYISADVDDDDINTVTTYQTWQGDGLEFFMGMYDLRKMNAWHGKNFVNANGDVRVGWNTLNQMTTDGSSVKAWSGVTYALYQKIFGSSGYIIEARLTLDSLAAGSKFDAVTNGFQFPLLINCNDIDPVVDHDVARSQILQVGSNDAIHLKADVDQEWLRPHTWGIAEVIGAPTAVNNEAAIPYEYKLENNYPNPFNPSTTINYSLKNQGSVTLRIYNLLGQHVATLVNEVQSAGPHSAVFDASRFSSGVYFYSIESGSFRSSKKMLLMK
ncbi:MAG: T9SS C-terminal target domain-containing protein [Ignavibacteriae bacterium]|nr:MAG: T9SS C-terminal target domain-containing protein [Ignavibacteriota bacterium]